MKVGAHPCVSVIIPTYNRAFCITQTLESVLGQSFEDFEVLVVDDGSTDETREVVTQFGAKVRYLYQPNLGVSAARNTGITAAKGDFVAFLDSDDEWMEDKLRLQWTDLNANTSAVAHMLDAKISDQDGYEGSLFELRGVRSEYESRPLRSRPLLDVLKTQFFTSTWMVRRDAIEQVGYFDTSMRIFEDLEYLSRIALCGSFFISSYIGTNMRRKQGRVGALSDFYETSKLESLQNVANIYDRLASDKSLSRRERDFVIKQLAATYLDQAFSLKLNGSRFAYLDAVKCSLKVSHSPFAIAKGVALLLLGCSAYERLKRLRNGTRREVRRSQVQRLS